MQNALRGALVAAILGLLALIVALRFPDPVAGALWPASPSAPTVVFVVVDTVRADHTSLCGYERPTTPYLEALAADGAAVACDAVAPGSWTLPSHASFFTGLHVPEHGAHFAAGASDAIRGMHLVPLSDEPETLAEAMAAAGYQTVGVSGNPVLTDASGLTRGFSDWTVAPFFEAMYGDRLVRAVRDAVARADRSEPLFLFVNIADAHDPWDGVPEGLSWVPPHAERVHYFSSDEPGLWEAFVGGTLSDAERAEQQALVTDLYDHAVSEADDTLRALMAMLETRGWTDGGLRLVVASDHGEFLGEHDLLRHGRYLWEPNNRVPVLFFQTPELGAMPAMPALPSALVVHDLVIDGVPSPTTPYAAAYPDRLWIERSDGRVGNETSAAMWFGTNKRLWVDGAVTDFDLARDPSEAHGLPSDQQHLGFDAYVEAVVRSGRQVGEMDPEMIEALRAAGYLDE